MPETDYVKFRIPAHTSFTSVERLIRPLESDLGVRSERGPRLTRVTPGRPARSHPVVVPRGAPRADPSGTRPRAPGRTLRCGSGNPAPDPIRGLVAERSVRRALFEPAGQISPGFSRESDPPRGLLGTERGFWPSGDSHRESGWRMASRVKNGEKWRKMVKNGKSGSGTQKFHFWLKLTGFSLANRARMRFRVSQTGPDWVPGAQSRQTR